MSSVRGRHQPELLSEFFDEESRQAWARQPDGGLFFLEQRAGTPAVRNRAREGLLVCPVDGCGAPAFTLVTPTVRRHFFRHRPGSRGKTGHGPESAFHVDAKHLLVRWAETQGATAKAEAVLVLPDGRTRRADALAVLPDGHRVAFEVEYKPLGLVGQDGWPDRHSDYTSLAVPDVWLFGHVRPHMNLARRSAGDDQPQDEVVLTDTQQHLAGTGAPVRWINPAEELIATAVVHGPDPDQAPDGWWEHPRAYGPRHPRRNDRRAFLHLDALADCTLTPDGMVTPTDLWIAGERAQIEQRAAEAKDAAARAADQQPVQEPAPPQPPPAARRPPAPTPKPPAPAPTSPPAAVPSAPGPGFRLARPDLVTGTGQALWHPTPALSWEEHPLRHQVSRLLPQTLRAIEEQLPTDQGIDADHRVWHATVYARLVHGNEGRSFNAGQAVEALFQDRYPHRHADRAHLAAMGYLDALVDAGLLEYLPGHFLSVVGPPRSGPGQIARPRVRVADGEPVSIS